MAKQITIGNLQFPTKKLLTEYVQKILAKYSPGNCLDKDDFIFVNQLLERHPNAVAKIGCGVDSIKIDIPQEWIKTRCAYKCFWVIRKDGSCVDFSFRECISASTPKAKFYEACRAAVVGQIAEFRKQHLAIYPALVELDVDHVIPFVQIAEAFIQAKEIDLESVEYKAETGAGRREFASLSLITSWQKFHAEKAELQILTHTANMKKGRKAVEAVQI